MQDFNCPEFEHDLLPPERYSALTLAYIGDCVYELYVRTHLISGGDKKVNTLHKGATGLVCAKAQAALYHKISASLTAEEEAVFHRGRNTKSQPPKNADVLEYRLATGVEALIGYLYLLGKTERVAELMRHLFQ